MEVESSLCFFCRPAWKERCCQGDWDCCRVGAALGVPALRGGCGAAVLLTRGKRVAVLGGVFGDVNQTLCWLLLNFMVATNRRLVSYLCFYCHGKQRVERLIVLYHRGNFTE